jgi:hypothetical protein
VTAPSPMERRQCTATSKQSRERCKRVAIAGGTVCVMHGGKSPVVAAAAARRLEAAELTQEVARLGLVVTTTPADAMLDALHRAYGDVLVLGAKVAQLEPESWSQLDTTARFEKASVLVEMYWRALDRYATVADSCVQRGIEAAAVGVAHAYAQQLLAFTRLLVEGLGHEADDPVVVELVQSSLRRVETGAA